ncbi:hypothetical protein [Desulfobacter latus]|uniref:Uncharacterized protein n=1 Tax=Desulfobacter latus TaxID=2292 RepID=A0A850SUF1_9BACT|nr:hypothetical protein [Desulfobacter latus]NWH04779.1 hypothetical protein [Desulfobacter latus]
MTSNFATLSLARLYEKQGYIDDALEMYRAMDTNQGADGKHIRDAIARLEAQKKISDSKEKIPASTQEARMAHMLEVWLRLIVMQKRVGIFKRIKARL